MALQRGQDIEFRNPPPRSSGCVTKHLFALSRKPFSQLYSFQQGRISLWKEGVVLVKTGWKMLKYPRLYFAGLEK